MKRNCTNNVAGLLLLMVAFLFQQCKPASQDGGHENHQQDETMHSESDGHKGYMPDSGVLNLVNPPNREIISNMPSIRVEKERRMLSVPLQGIIAYDTRNYVSVASRFSGRVEKLTVKYNYQYVSKGQLIMQVYAPDVANAQRELIYLHTSDADAHLVEAAKKRLRLLGITDTEIGRALKTGEPLYYLPVYAQRSGYLVERTSNAPQSLNTPAASPASSMGDDGMGMGSTASSSSVNVQPVGTPAASPLRLRQGQYISAGQSLFTLYDDQSLVAAFYFPPDMAAYARPGKQFMFYPAARPDEVFFGTIGLIEPVQREGQNFTLARVYLPRGQWQTGTRLSGTIAVTTQRNYWVPRTAVVSAGMQQIVFYKDRQKYLPRYVRTGLRIGNYVEVLDDIGGWEIAPNAWFLVDSESFISATKAEQKVLDNE
jgi:membrane fusion protein, copper/silver efflux system